MKRYRRRFIDALSNRRKKRVYHTRRRLLVLVTGARALGPGSEIRTDEANLIVNRQSAILIGPLDASRSAIAALTADRVGSAPQRSQWRRSPFRAAVVCEVNPPPRGRARDGRDRCRTDRS